MVLVVLSYTYASTGTSSQRSGLYCAGASQLCTVLWMANRGVAAGTPRNTTKVQYIKRVGIEGHS